MPPKRVSNSQIRSAQRKVESELRSALRKVEANVNRELHVAQRKAEADANRQMRSLERKAQSDLNRRVRAARARSKPTVVSYTQSELIVAERVSRAVAIQDEREVDIFLSYATSDGSTVARELCSELTARGLSVWFGEVSLQPGKSQALAMDRGIRDAHAGVVVLTPAFLAGRFWTDRELGALLHKETVIPVAHGVSFEQISNFSAFLPDLHGFSTERDPVAEIAEKIARTVASEPALA